MDYTVLAEIEADVIAGVTDLGPAFRADPVVRKFAGPRISRAQVYRVIDKILRSRKPADHLDATIEEAVKRRSDAAGGDAEAASEAAAAELVSKLPPVPRLDEVVSSGGIAAMASKLASCIEHAEQVVKFCKTADGNVRNMKGLLSASEHLRKSLDTAIKLQGQVVEMANARDFHKAIYQAILQESPTAAERIIARVRQVGRQFDYLTDR